MNSLGTANFAEACGPGDLGFMLCFISMGIRHMTLGEEKRDCTTENILKSHFRREDRTWSTTEGQTDATKMAPPRQRVILTALDA